MFVIEYNFGIEWHTYKETSNAYRAKQDLKALKKHVGKDTKTRIRKI